MTHTQRNEWLAAQWAEGLIVRSGSLKSFANRPWGEVRNLEIFPGIYLKYDCYEVPRSWVPPGSKAGPISRKLEIQSHDGAIIPEYTNLGQNLRRTLYALALPRRTGRSIRSFKPSTWLLYARRILRIVQVSQNLYPSSSGKLWSHLKPSEFVEVVQRAGYGKQTVRRIWRLVQQLQELAHAGIIPDCPPFSAFQLSDSELSAVEVPPSSRMSPNTPSHAMQSFLPFSDEFVSEFLSRAIWIQRNLADQLIDCWSKIISVKALERKNFGRNKLHSAQRDIVETYEWFGEDGKYLTELPWDIFTYRTNNDNPRDWKPVYPKTISSLIFLLQTLNVCLVAFCTGARSSELLSITTDSLDNLNGRLVSRTFKTVDSVGGETREWPLHPVAIRAFEQQLKLSALLRADGEKHLWISLRSQVNRAGDARDNISNGMHAAATTFGLEHLLQGRRAHSHRWRHTVGRLVALSVNSAPQILQDLFGHRDVGMTLTYMLSDPQIAQEARAVAEATAETLAIEAVTEIDSGLAGGPAAPSLGQGISRLKMEKGEEFYGVENLQELAEVLTFHGKYWELVRPGVICTKALGEYGPCTKGQGAPDAGSCRTTCLHRLELERAHRDCESSLASLIVEYEQAETRGEVFLVANLEGQILAQLHRWPDVRNRALANSLVAARIWAAGH